LFEDRVVVSLALSREGWLEESIATDVFDVFKNSCVDLVQKSREGYLVVEERFGSNGPRGLSETPLVPFTTWSECSKNAMNRVNLRAGK